MAGVLLRHQTLAPRMRPIAFAVFTGFCFLKAGQHVSLPGLLAAAGLVLALLLIEMASKYLGVWPLAVRPIAC